MKSFQDFLEGRCWPGHKPVPGKKPYSPGSCVKETVSEDLRNWFNPNHPKGGWKRVNAKGEVVGDCAREPGEPKPKCMSNAQRASLSKKEKAAAVRRKRAQDPNPERQGPPINVKSKVDESMEILNEKNKPTNPELWSRAIAQAKSKFDVYPSAYANGWAAKWYKSKGGGWKSVSEETESSNLREASEVFKSIRFAKGEPRGKKHSSTDDEEHGTVGELEFDQQVKHVKKRAMQEAKEKTEYDYEGDMARGQLQSIINNAQRVHDMLEDNDNLPEWVQSKITLAEDYISTVANYMMSEVDEEVVAEGSGPKEKQKTPYRDINSPEYRAAADKQKQRMAKDKAAEPGKKLLAKQGVAEGYLEEVSLDLAKRARDKAEKHVDWDEDDMRDRPEGYSEKQRIKFQRYIDRKKSKNKGMAEEVEQLEEGRPSQRHPLEGHEYHKKTDAELVHIAKDAHAAAEAMKSHNTDAENKYRDQANDSATVRYYRQKHGMADWYKKKYGHIKEEVVGEALSPAIRMQMALKKAREDRERSERNGEAAMAGKFSSGPAKQPMKNPTLVSPKNEEVIVEDDVINKVPKPPFDGPHKAIKGNVKDKSGAVHTPMSRVRDIARTAARKQAGIKEAADVNDPLNKIDTQAKRSLSRTAGMVKDLATNAKSKAKEKAKKDTFEAEPELSSQIIKQ